MDENGAMDMMGFVFGMAGMSFGLMGMIFAMSALGKVKEVEDRLNRLISQE